MHRMLRISLMSALLLSGYILYAQESPKQWQCRSGELKRHPVKMEPTIEVTFASDRSQKVAHSPTHR